jgi:hypothetical protein
VVQSSASVDLSDDELSSAAIVGQDPDAGRQLLERCEGDPRRLIAFGLGELGIFVGTMLLHRLPVVAVTRAAVQAKMRELRKELEGPRPTPLESLLAERIVTCWLEVQIADLAAATTSPPSEQIAKHHDEMRSRAEARYYRAIKALAAVRKLDLPAVQINLAGQQVVMQ